MKKLLSILAFLVVVLIPSIANSATYYGCADQEITAAGTFETQADCEGSVLSWASLADGDVLVANGHAITIANDIGSGDVTATLSTATNGGSYTFDISAATAKTLYVNVTAGTTPGLIVTGAGAGADTTELTIIGNATGGSATSAYGIRLEHTLGNIPITGTITGGSGTSSHGLHSTSAGKFALTGNAAGATGNGINSASTSIFTVAGNCSAASGTDAGVGCYCGASTGYGTITGNVVNGPRATGVTGACRWTPAVPANGVTGHYVKFDGGGTAIYAGSNTDDASKALTTFYYIDPSDGTTDQGSSSTTGGGAWGW